MAYELDSEMRSRLARHYRQVSDAELLDAVARLDDLTPIAQDVIHAELNSRGLERAWPNSSSASTPARSTAQAEEWLPDPYGASRPTLPKPEFGMPLERGKVPLITLADAITAGEACRYLDEAEISFDLQEVPLTNPRRGTHADGAVVRLRLVVRAADQDQAKRLLQEKLGLFPTEEIAEPDTPEDDGTKITLGVFANRDDAEDVARILNESGIWNIAKANAEGSVETEDAFLVGVREVDLIRAGELVEKALNLPEA